ncbi:hypothetical protein QOT17_006555 [Balamuthia mandrillaris]
MFGRKSNSTGLVDTTHLFNNLWVRQLQETQCELPNEARGVDNIQKKKMEKQHGKPEDEFKLESRTYKIIEICSLQTIKVLNTAGPEMDKVVNLNCIK